MVNPVVERATSAMLGGPNWSINIGVCDICNRDPGQVKDIVKGIKRRLGSKNVKVQLLALTLLETIVKNCGDFVHMNVAERKLLHYMVKLVKKKPDFHVKEKILILIDTWQEAFGGARARYPQYYAAYNELLHMGALFPKRTERSPPVFTPLQTHPLKRNPENESDAVESSAEAKLPVLSLKETRNAHHVVDVLAEMLAAINPEKKEGLRDEVVLDLVLQCRRYKKRVVHLVNSTSEEALLREGLALNDNLQSVLDKYEALVSGASASSSKLKPKTIQALVSVNVPLIGTKEHQNTRSTVDAGAEAQSRAPVINNGSSATPGKVNPKFDLLSGDDFNTPTTQNFLAIVPLNQPQPATPVSQLNHVAVVDTVSQNNWEQKFSAGQTSSFPQIQNSQHFPPKKTPVDSTQYEQGGIPAAKETYSASSEFEESQCPQFHTTSYNPNGCIKSILPPQYESMYSYTQVPHPAAGQRYSNLASLNPNRNIPAASHPNMLPSPYEPISSYGQTYPPQFQHFSPSNSNGSLHNMVPLHCDPTSSYSEGSNYNPMRSSHLPQQQPSSRDYGTQIRHELPPPPWETQAPDNNNQVMSIHMLQKNTGGAPSPLTLQAIHFEQIHQQLQVQRSIGVLPHHEMDFQQIPQQIYSDQMVQPYEYGGGYTQLQNPQFLDTSISNASYALLPSQNASKSKDIFEDLVKISNFKPNKATGKLGV